MLSVGRPVSGPQVSVPDADAPSTRQAVEQ